METPGRGLPKGKRKRRILWKIFLKEDLTQKSFVFTKMCVYIWQLAKHKVLFFCKDGSVLTENFVSGSSRKSPCRFLSCFIPSHSFIFYFAFFSCWTRTNCIRENTTDMKFIIFFTPVPYKTKTKKFNMNQKCISKRHQSEKL